MSQHSISCLQKRDRQQQAARSPPLAWLALQTRRKRNPNSSSAFKHGVIIFESGILGDVSGRQAAVRCGSVLVAWLPDQLNFDPCLACICDRCRSQTRKSFTQSLSIAWSLTSPSRRILALYHHYAVLITASPLLKSDPNIWQEMIADTVGYTILTRARDAAVEIVRAICLVCRVCRPVVLIANQSFSAKPEIKRTLQ